MGLLDIVKSLPTINELKGGFGERLTEIYAKTFPDAFVLRDILIDGAEGHTAQIDLVVIDTRGIYVIEIKNYPEARLYGDTAKAKWLYYNHGKKYEIYSPLKQNQKHVAYLKIFLQHLGDFPFFSIVTTICDDFKVSGKNPPNTVLCNSLPAMKRGMQLLSENQPAVLTDTQKQLIFDYICTHQHGDRLARTQHKESVISYKKELDTLQAQKKCPYCKIDLVQRNGKYGAFWGCPNYPKCKHTQK